jgi:acyl transferase domain-containing protein
VYVGCMYQEYLDLMGLENSSKLPPQALIGSGDAFMVGRLAYSFGFCGPCVSTNTACSSSLVAAHLAHVGLLNSESSAAVAAGSNMMLDPTTTSGICQLQVSIIFMRHHLTLALPRPHGINQP